MGPMDEAGGWLAFFDSKTRRGGILYGLSDTVFFTGPTFGIDSPRRDPGLKSHQD